MRTRVNTYLFGQYGTYSVRVCVCLNKRASGLFFQGVICSGTSYIIDLLLRFAHVAPPGDGVSGGCGLVEGGQQACTGGFKYFRGPFSFI